MPNSPDEQASNLKSDLIDGLDRCRDLLLHYKAVLGAPANDAAPLPQDEGEEPQDQVG